MALTRSSLALALVTALLAALGTVVAPTAQAATFTVTTSVDGDDGTCSAGHCTLREAIKAANAAGGSSTVTFAPATDGVVIGVSMADLPEITAKVTIAGNGTGATIISGAEEAALVSVTGEAQVAVQDLTLTTAGRAGSGAAARALGGATLALDRVVVRDSVSTNSPNGFGYGGAVFAGAGSTVTVTGSSLLGNGAYAGGAVAAAGTVVVRSSTLADNTAEIFGGAVYVDTAGAVSLVNSTVVGNSAQEAGAGYIQTAGSLTAVFSTLSGNTSAPGSFTSTVSGPGSFGATGSILHSSDVMCLLPLPVVGGGYNVYREPGGTDSCGLGSASGNINADPVLAALADNGGPTQTMRPEPGSPVALNPMPRDGALAVLGDAFDQRGAARVGDFWIGAMQDVPAVTVNPASLTLPAVLTGETSTAALDISNNGPADLRISQATVSGGEANRFAVQDPSACLNVPLRPGRTCSLRVTASANNPGTYVAAIDIVDDGPGSPRSIPVSVTVAWPKPVVSAVSPSSGSAAGGTAVTISGRYFRAAPDVRFGGQQASEVTFVSAQEIRAVSPPHALGPVDITVSDAEAGSGTLANAFAYTADTGAAQVQQAPGTASMLVNGQPVPVGITVGPSGTGLLLSGGGVDMNLAGLNWIGGGIPVGPYGTLQLFVGGEVTAMGGGLWSGTTASLFAFGGTWWRAAPRPIAQAVVGADGQVSLLGVVDTGVGPTTVQVVGVSDSGYPVVLSVGAEVVSGERARQRPTRAIRPPDHLRPVGLTRLVRLPVRTNAGQVARVRVTCAPTVRSAPAGDVVACRVVRTRNWVGVRLTGDLATIVRVRIHAPAVPGYTAYTRALRYRTPTVG